jgi:hypothetical protein
LGNVADHIPSGKKGNTHDKKQNRNDLSLHGIPKIPLHAKTFIFSF